MCEGVVGNGRLRKRNVDGLGLGALLFWGCVLGDCGVVMWCCGGGALECCSLVLLVSDAFGLWSCW